MPTEKRALRQTSSRPKNSEQGKVVGTSQHGKRSKAPRKGSQTPSQKGGPGRTLKGKFPELAKGEPQTLVAARVHLYASR